MQQDKVNKGQAKLHKLRNDSTGEELEISQAEFKTRREELKAAGFVRIDEDGTEIEETEPPAEPTQ